MEGQGFVKISEIEATKRLNDSLEQVAAPWHAEVKTSRMRREGEGVRPLRHASWIEIERQREREGEREGESREGL